jgi:ribonuclease R
MMRRGGQRRIGAPPLSTIVVVERFGSDRDGLPLARVIDRAEGLPRNARIVETGCRDDMPIGGRAVAQLTVRDTGEIEARIVRRLDPPGGRIVGVMHAGAEGSWLLPADRRHRTEYRIEERDAAGAGDGELVVAEPLLGVRSGPPRARIIARLGLASAPGAFSLIAIAAAGIPTEFPPAAIAEAEAALPASPIGRADLRHIPLVTIDDSDARDFDDAVWAEADPGPASKCGWHLIVAIADVAWYVPAGGALDREAERRGNSVYFPDRVVPMLPEALSNELCSLQAGVDRACLAVHLWVDAAGRKRRHRFERGVMRSAARLTYEQVQAAQDGLDPPAGTVPRELVAPLYAVYAVLAQARAARGALELEIAEDRFVLDAENRPSTIVPGVRLDSHRLVEEFMILANVAAAEELEARRAACLYRVHDAPDPEKLIALRDALDRLGLPGLALAKGQAPKSELFNRLLRRAAATPAAGLVNDLVLRSQAQAAYSPDNIGHYGLALPRYVHFTSPIRRYADLLVHRALTVGAKGGSECAAGSLPRDIDGDRLAAIGEHVSATERRAAAAERAAAERYRAAFMAPSIGRLFAARISGVAEYGLFVTAIENGASGLAPISMLPGDRYDLDQRALRLKGRSTGRIFGLGDAVSVQLVEADAMSGRLVFRIADDSSAAFADIRAEPRVAGHSGRSNFIRRRRG